MLVKVPGRLARLLRRQIPVARGFLPEVDQFGPIFVSYRDKDGAEKAAELAWRMRGIGLPVWLDKDDLPPGETNTRLNEALGRGLSGAVLLVTPGVRDSTVIRRLELPRLLALQQDPRFSFAIANTIDRDGSSGKADHGAPNRLLGKTRPSLSDVKQYPYCSPSDAGEVALAMAMARMETIRELKLDELDVDVATRIPARAFSSGGLPGLVIRVQTPSAGRRAVGGKAWEALSAAVGNLPILLTESGVSAVRFRGNAHLTIAFALGAAVPTPTSWRVSVEPHVGEIWPDVDGTKPDVDVRTDALGDGAHLAVLVDCVEHPLVVDSFTSLVDQSKEPLAAKVMLTRNGRCDPDAGGALADVLADTIRAEAARFGTPVLLLALRAPFPVALMLGRRLNTFEVHLYEWEDSLNPPQYVKTATVASGRGPVVSVEHNDMEDQ
jgi:hypothetical protein